MSEPTQHLELEGRWEEIVQNGEQLAGRIVRVTTVDDLSQQALRDEFERLMEEFEKTPLGGAAPVKDRKSEVSDAIAEKFRRQGLSA